MITRKTFLKKSLAIGAGITMPGSLFSSIIVPQKKEKLGVALVGLGYYSTDLLAPALQMTQHCELKGVVSGTPSKIERWKKQYDLFDKNIYTYESFDRIADNPEIDVVYVVLPPSMHAEYAIRAAKAGKHVWCEKPMALTEAECSAMINACRIAMREEGEHKVSLDQVIRTMYLTGLDMQSRYKETSLAGLALNVIEC